MHKIVILLFILTVMPCTSQAEVSLQTQSDVASAAAPTEINSQGATAGIRPVSPEEFAGKVDSLIDRIYKAITPVADSIAKIMLLVAGIVIMFSVFGGVSFFTRVLGGAVLSVVIGLSLLYGAPYIVGLIKGLN